MGCATVLIATASGSADSANQFAVHDNWNTAFDRDRPRQAKNTEPNTYRAASRQAEASPGVGHHAYLEAVLPGAEYRKGNAGSCPGQPVRDH